MIHMCEPFTHVDVSTQYTWREDTYFHLKNKIRLYVTRVISRLWANIKISNRYSVSDSLRNFYPTQLSNITTQEPIFVSLIVFQTHIYSCKHTAYRTIQTAGNIICDIIAEPRRNTRCTLYFYGLHSFILNIFVFWNLIKISWSELLKCCRREWFVVIFLWFLLV